MTTKHLSFLARIAIIAVFWLPAAILFAQSAEIPPVPAPTPGSIPSETGPNAQIRMDDGNGASFKLRGLHSRRVLLGAGQKTTVVLQYDLSYAGLALEVAAMDGGSVSFPGNRNLVAPNGTVVLQFSDAQQPGLYRLALNCGGTTSTLQFWVPDPEAPSVDASVAIPQALPSATPNPSE